MRSPHHSVSGVGQNPDSPPDTDLIRKVPPPILDRENRNVERINDGPTGSQESRVLAFSATGIQNGEPTN
jgi:hypothetical protein